MKLHLLNTDIYVERRKQLANAVAGGKILLLGNRESSVNFKDNWYPFRQDSTFLYFTGLNMPNLDLIIDAHSGVSTLYGDELTMEDIIWTGPMPSLQEIAERIGIHDVRPQEKLSEELNEGVHFLPPYRPRHVARTSQLGSFSEELIEAIIKQRNCKSAEEVASLHEACTRSNHMHYEVMSQTRSGMHEYELVSIARSFGGRSNSNFGYLPICTTKGHVLHNHSYDNILSSGDMVLLDAGLESDLMYTGDISRTFPVDRKFTAIQADIYQVVLNAHKAASRKCDVGRTFLDVHMEASKTIISGLIDLDLMKGDPEEAAAAGAHTLFFPHGLGHVLGLDVHDMENFGEEYVGYGSGMVKSKEFGLKSLRLGRPLEDGFVITIEPGIYLIPELISKFQAEKKHTDFINYKNVEKIKDFSGIRIEDNYLISEDGISLLGEPLAREVAEIEEIRMAANQ